VLFRSLVLRTQSTDHVHPSITGTRYSITPTPTPTPTPTGMNSSCIVIAAVVGIIIAWLRQQGGDLLDPPLSLRSAMSLHSANKTFLVTGASSGLGFSTVAHLARDASGSTDRAGMMIILACRDRIKCRYAQEQIEATTDANVVKLVALVLDLESLESIEAFVNRLQLHVKIATSPLTLIANAGVMAPYPSLQYNRDTHVEQHMHVNHLAHVYLVHLLLAQGFNLERVTMVSSLMAAPRWDVAKGWYLKPPAHVKPPIKSTFLQFYNNMLAYGKSKRANLLFASELQKRQRNIILTITAAHPGLSATSIFKALNDWLGITQMPLGISLLPSLAMTSDQGAWTTLRASLMEEGGKYVGPRWGIWGDPILVGTLGGSWHHIAILDEESERVWNMTMEALDIQNFGVVMG